MFCKHKWQITHSNSTYPYWCVKCGKRSRGVKTYRRKNKKIGITIGVICALTVCFFLIYPNVAQTYITIPSQNFAQIQLPKFSDLPNIKMPIAIPNAISNFTTIATKPQQLLQDVTKPQQTSIADSQQAISYINKIRANNGIKPINFDKRVFDIALARAKDNYDYGYFDHTNPKTGTCAYTIKSQFGLANNEDVAENLFLEGYVGSPTLSNPQLTTAIDSWMSDFGHEHNLLFPDHVSGAVACYGGICAFEGLNYEGFGQGCYTASQGEAQFGKLDNCSNAQMNQYLSLEQQLDAMKPKLQGMPQTATSQAQYDYYNALVTQYNNLVNQINNFKC